MDASFFENLTEISTNLISTSIEKYQNNPFILSRLKQYITNIPDYLDSENTKHEQKINRNNELTNEQETFCKLFLNEHKYYYLPNNSTFYLYKDNTYSVVSEDSVHYQLLQYLSKEPKLSNWKHKTKVNIIKKIKERHLFSSIPDTQTFQTVLDFLKSTLFDHKNEAKYFLTILGDNLLKKNTDIIAFVSSDTKRIARLFNNIAFDVLNCNVITNNFVSKYHTSHNNEKYRIIHTKECSMSDDMLRPIIDKIGIDILCVATHYSNRYESSENFLQTKLEQVSKNRVLYLANNSQESIINNFISECITEVDDAKFSLSWKNIHYIWNVYLNKLGVPNMIYANSLKLHLTKKLPFNHLTEVFNNVTSKHLPLISNFLSFWNTHMTISGDVFDEYEADELTILYKRATNISILEEDIIKLIGHFFAPEVEIIDNKYVRNIKCNLWDKSSELETALVHIKHQLIKPETKKGSKKSQPVSDDTNNSILISFDELYDMYKSYTKANSIVHVSNINMLVSKQYFKKFVSYYLFEFVKFNEFIDESWLNSPA